MRTNHKIFIVLAFFALGGVAACSHKHDSDAAGAAGQGKQRYYCPMHPQYTSDKQGDCPICNMRLVPIEEDKAADTPAAPAEKKVLFYRNPMNPAVTSPVPAKDEMGMDYVPVYAEDAEMDSGVSGQGSVKIKKGSEQQIGVNVSMVEMKDLFITIKAPSRVAYDPDLYSAILEYQEARKNRSRGTGEGRSESESTARASRLRLRQMGLSDQQIEEMGRPGFDPSNLLLGQAGGKVWVYVDIYDYEAGFVKPGQKAEFTSPAFPGQPISGTVRAVDSIVNSETRTLRVRVEVPNPKGELKPEMYLSATIHAALGKKLAVPDSAVLDTGTRQLVYVQTSAGQYEPREIRVGREASGYYEVLSGVKAGDMVVTSANFLIDSESKIRGAVQGSK
jgi:Cu(I)/Ag(I) efflux system membrane fusion protein